MELVAPTRITGVVSVEIAPPLACASFQPEEASRSSCVGVAFVAWKEQESIRMPMLDARIGCTIPDPATWIEQEYQEAFDDPARRSANRHHETGSIRPEEAPCVDNQSRSGQAQVEPSSLQNVNAHFCRALGHANDGSESFGGVELLWNNYFQHPSDWWDSRDDKPHPNSPDFRHKRTKDALWICSLSTPEWVSEALRRKTPSRQGDSYATGSYGERTPVNTVNLRLSQADVLSWTDLILRQVKIGQDREALRVYERLRESGVKLISKTFVAALKACSSLRDLESAKRIHSEAVGSGFESDVYVGTMLVDVYGKCKRLVEARGVFEKMPHRNVVSWNAMILAYAQMEEGEEALQLYSRMLHEGVAPNERTFVAALKAYSSLTTVVVGNEADGKQVKTRCLKQVRALHSDIVKSGAEDVVFVGTMLVDVYAKCGSLVDARHVFEKMPHRDVVCWNAMISGYAQMEDGGSALQLYAQMHETGVAPDERTFVGALKACCSLAASDDGTEAGGLLVENGCLEQVKAIHSQVLKSGCQRDVFVGTMLVDAYVKCGNLEDARRFFDKMPHRNVVSWTAMICGYAQRGEGEEALRLYEQMQQESVLPDERAFVAALKACSCLAASQEGMERNGRDVKSLCLEQVRAIHSDIRRMASESDLFVGNMLVDVYAKCGSLADARCVFEAMPRHDIVSWTSMISGYAQMEEGETALLLYARMQQEGFPPDARAFVGALKACGTVAGLDTGKGIHAQILETGLEATDPFVASSLIDMYGRCGSMGDAQQVFDALPTRGSVTWRALIAGYARQGDSDRVFQLLETMKQQDRIEPESSTLVSVLTVCSHAGLLDKGKSYFHSMSHQFSITPTMEHYSCMVDLLGRSGDLDGAMAMAKAMPSPPDSTVWRAVLSACRQWCNVEVGREAFKLAVEVDESDAAAYVLMANIYAAAQMWEEAREVQARRMKTESWKQPGQSLWADVDGSVHSFAVREQEHPLIQCVYSKLDDLYVKLEEEGYQLHADTGVSG